MQTRIGWQLDPRHHSFEDLERDGRTVAEVWF